MFLDNGKILEFKIEVITIKKLSHMSVRISLLRNIRIEREVSLESSHGTCRHDRLQTQYILTYYNILYY